MSEAVVCCFVPQARHAVDAADMCDAASYLLWWKLTFGWWWLCMYACASMHSHDSGLLRVLYYCSLWGSSASSSTARRLTTGSRDFVSTLRRTIACVMWLSPLQGIALLCRQHVYLIACLCDAACTCVIQNSVTYVNSWRIKYVNKTPKTKQTKKHKNNKKTCVLALYPKLFFFYNTYKTK